MLTLAAQLLGLAGRSLPTALPLGSAGAAAGSATVDSRAPHDAGQSAASGPDASAAAAPPLPAASADAPLPPWNSAAFAAIGLPAALAALGIVAPPQDDPRVRLEVPDLAESGAVVPADLASAIPDTRRLILLILNNPNTLAADFHPGPQLWPRLSTRVKLAESTAVVAVAVTPLGVYTTQRMVKVTAGGCGG